MDDDPEELCFSYTFEQQSFLVGCARAVLYMSCTDHDDMDVFVQLRKADRQGNILQHINVPLKDLGVQEPEVESINPLKYLGPTGILRASHRSIDANLSWSDFPEHDYTKSESIIPGQIVKLDIGLWQAGIAFEPGERIVLKISGHNMVLAEFPPLRGTCRTGNKGKHNVHLGGEQKSHVLIPMVTL